MKKMVLALSLSTMLMSPMVFAEDSKVKDEVYSANLKGDGNDVKEYNDIVKWEVQQIHLLKEINNQNFFAGIDKLSKDTNDTILYSNQVSDADLMPMVILKKSILNKDGNGYDLNTKFNTILNESTIDTSFGLSEGNDNDTYVDISKRIGDVELTRSILLKSSVNSHDSNKINTKFYIRSFLSGNNINSKITEKENKNKNELQLIEYGKNSENHVLSGNYDLSLGDIIIIKLNNTDVILFEPIRIRKNNKRFVNTSISEHIGGLYNVNLKTEKKENIN